MQNITLYPELIDYIYNYCNEFKTEDELIAGKTFIHLLKDPSERMKKVMLKAGWISNKKEFKELMKDGYTTFKERVTARIFLEHKDKLKLNLCPKCFKITRTPNSKQCRFCFHDWH